jgi:C4-dicarboxylate-binding protein DctP
MSTIFRALSIAALAGVALSWSAVEASAQTVIKLGHDQPDRSTHHQAALKWKEMVEARTNGQVRIQIFPAMQLGSGTQMVEQVQAGAVEAAVLPTAWIAPVSPPVQVLDLPFLFPTRAVAYAVMDGPVGVVVPVVSD